MKPITQAENARPEPKQDPPQNHDLIHILLTALVIIFGLLAWLGFGKHSPEKEVENPCASGHHWMDASCTFPQTCITCGFQNGAAPGHQWLAASCETPETCALCGKTNGEAMGHQWQEANYTNPQTCSVCGSTVGSAMEHPEITLANSLRKELNICLSNLSEQQFGERHYGTEHFRVHDIQSMDMAVLLQFLFEHRHTNNRTIRSRTNSDGELYMTVDEINGPMQRLFGRTVTAEEAAALGFYTVGNTVYGQINTSLWHNRLSLTDTVRDLGNGCYEVEFRIFETDDQYCELNFTGVITEADLYEYTVEEAYSDTSLYYYRNGIALVKPTKVGSVDTFQILTYQILEPSA